MKRIILVMLAITAISAQSSEVYTLGKPSGEITRSKGKLRKALRAGKSAWSCKKQRYSEMRDSLKAVSGKPIYVIGTVKGTDDADLAFETAEKGGVVYKCNEQMIDGKRITNI